MNLLYHRVNRLTPDHWDLCVTAKHFGEHLDVIRRLSPRPRVTFDDGYADNYLSALPLLERYDVPGIFFIVSGAIGRKTEMWWDAIDRLFPNPAEYQSQFWRMRQLPYEEQEESLDALFAERNFSRNPRAGRRMMTEDELIALAKSPLAEIGAHTATHPVLAKLSHVRQQSEIIQSKAYLEGLLSRGITAFSYPNGMRADYTAETTQIVREAGFSCAYSAFDHDDWNDAFQLPRTMVRDWDGEEFERRTKGG